jgi:hypothetical protein
MRTAVVAVTAVLLFFVTAFRLEAQDNGKNESKKPDHDHQTYLKGGLVHTESEMEGFNIVVNGPSVDLETYFNKHHAGLSGWFIGYRKDDLRYSDFGHVLNAGVFSTVGTPAVELKFAGGVEWGVTSLAYNRTRFNYDSDRLVSYEHFFLQKNTDIPALGPSHDSVMYPFVEAGILKRWEWFLVEAGIRGNIQKFGFDRYDLDGDEVSFYPINRTRIVPSFFIKLGFALGGN